MGFLSHTYLRNFFLLCPGDAVEAIGFTGNCPRKTFETVGFTRSASSFQDGPA
jgi:hypothetical protein